jgi:hypothetical protein
MSRLTTGLVALALVAGAAGGATAQPEVAASGDDERDDAVEQIIGGYLGLAVGGRTTPGGLAVGGSYLYRLSDRDFFDASVGFVLGSGDAGCFRDREDDRVCDHGVVDGFAGELGLGLRRHFADQQTMSPFLRLGVAARIVSYGGDDLVGGAFPLVVGGGVRSRVAPHVRVVGAAELRVGLAQFGDGVGGEPHLALAVLGGVEFELH